MKFGRFKWLKTSAAMKNKKRERYRSTDRTIEREKKDKRLARAREEKQLSLNCFVN
ncbi:MAG: hypothetical protein ACTS40_02175 [Candidatus Hodgkinia cicadicola]